MISHWVFTTQIRSCHQQSIWGNFVQTTHHHFKIPSDILFLVNHPFNVLKWSTKLSPVWIIIHIRVEDRGTMVGFRWRWRWRTDVRRFPAMHERRDRDRGQKTEYETMISGIWLSNWSCESELNAFCACKGGARLSALPNPACLLTTSDDDTTTHTKNIKWGGSSPFDQHYHHNWPTVQQPAPSNLK